MTKDVIIRGRMFGEPSELNLTRLAKDKDSLFHQLIVKAIKKERNKWAKEKLIQSFKDLEE